MTPLRNFTFVHFGMQIFQGIGGGGVIAPPVPPVVPPSGGGSGAFDAAKYRIKKPKVKQQTKPEETLLCVSAHHVGAQWGMAVVEVTRSPKPSRQQQMIVALFIAQHGNN